MKLKKSIEHISLAKVNQGKIAKIDEIAAVYQGFMQQVVDWHWQNNVIPKQFLDNQQFTSVLSERYKQTAGLQAIRTVKSYWSKVEEYVRSKITQALQENQISQEQSNLYYSANKWHLWFEKEELSIEIKKNKKKDDEKQILIIPTKVLSFLLPLALEAKEKISKPVIKNLTLELDAKVGKLEKGNNSFEYWIKFSTLQKRKIVYLPLIIHEQAQKQLEGVQLKNFVKLKKRNDRWYASFCTEKEIEQTKPDDKPEVGVDVGVKALLVDSQGDFYGTDCYDSLKSNIDKVTEYHKRRQKLTHCLKKKYGPDTELSDKRYRKKQNALTSRRKNEIGRAINQFVKKNKDKTIVLEKLDLSGKKQSKNKKKSQKVNRILNRSLMGYLKNKLIFRILEWFVSFIFIQPAYSSQECLLCGWVSRKNRPCQEKFKCEICDFQIHADLGASLVIKGRSHDKKLNSIQDYRLVKELLLKRFYDTHSVSSWLDLDSFLDLSGKEFREALNRQSAKLKLKIV